MTAKPAACAAVTAFVGLVLLYALSFVSSILNSDEDNLTNADVRGRLLAAHTRRILEMPQAATNMIAALPYTGQFNVAYDASWSETLAIWTAMAGSCDGTTNGLMYGLTGNDGSYFCVYCGNMSLTSNTTVQFVSRVRYDVSNPYLREYFYVTSKYGGSTSSSSSASMLLNVDTVTYKTTTYRTMAKSWVTLAFETGTPVYQPETISFSTGAGQNTYLAPVFNRSGQVVGTAATWLEPIFWTTKFETAGSGFMLMERPSSAVIFCTDAWNTSAPLYSQQSSTYYNSDILAMVDALDPADPTKQGSTQRFVSRNAYVSVYSVNMLFGQTSVSRYGPGAAGLDMAVISVLPFVTIDLSSKRPVLIFAVGAAVTVIFTIIIFVGVKKCTPTAGSIGRVDMYAVELNAEK